MKFLSFLISSLSFSKIDSWLLNFFLFSSFITFFISLGLNKISNVISTENEELGRKDGFLIASLVWIFAGLLGSLPYIFSSTLVPILYPHIIPVFDDNSIGFDYIS